VKHSFCLWSAQDTVFYGINYGFSCLNECSGCSIFSLFVALSYYNISLHYLLWLKLYDWKSHWKHQTCNWVFLAKNLFISISNFHSRFAKPVDVLFMISVHRNVEKKEYKTDKDKTHFPLSATHRSNVWQCYSFVYSCMSLCPKIWLCYGFYKNNISRIIIFKLIKYILSYLCYYKNWIS
jgi:hypothetical protein